MLDPAILFIPFGLTTLGYLRGIILITTTAQDMDDMDNFMIVFTSGVSLNLFGDGKFKGGGGERST